MFGDPEYDPVDEDIVNTTANPTPHLEYTLRINKPVNTFNALQPSSDAFIAQSTSTPLSGATPDMDAFDVVLQEYSWFPHNATFDLNPNPLVY